MLKKLWKLVRSDEKVQQALRQTNIAYDLSPDAPLIAANDEPQLTAPPAPASADGAKPRLWLQDWSKRDEERLKQPLHWEGYTTDTSAE